MTYRQLQCGVSRRFLLASTTMVAISVAVPVLADVVRGQEPAWRLMEASPPDVLPGGRWYFLTPAEIQALEAIADRMVPSDDLSMGGKDAGCVDYIDRQLAGPYGVFSGHYREGPFLVGVPEQGDQSPLTPRERYRIGLKSLDDHCRRAHGAAFSALPDERKDEILTGLEVGRIRLEGIDSSLFFDQVLQNIMEGFFADPIYGGNREMTSWRMIGFPGARYNYYDYVEKHNQKLNLEPVGLKGGPGWCSKD